MNKVSRDRKASRVSKVFRDRLVLASPSKEEVDSAPSGSGGRNDQWVKTFTPEQGDAVIDTTDDSLYVFDGSDWVDGGSIQGPQGIQGRGRVSKALKANKVSRDRRDLRVFRASRVSLALTPSFPDLKAQKVHKGPQGEPGVGFDDAPADGGYYVSGITASG